MEKESAKKWPANWSFLKTKYTDVSIEGFSLCAKILPPPRPQQSAICRLTIWKKNLRFTLRVFVTRINSFNVTTCTPSIIILLVSKAKEIESCQLLIPRFYLSSNCSSCIVWLFTFQLVKDDFPSKSSKPKELPPHLKLPPITPVEKYIKVLPSPHPFPRTTTSLYGWRSSSYEHRLERYGGYARNRGTLVKQLNWPPEGIS